MPPPTGFWRVVIADDAMAHLTVALDATPLTISSGGIRRYTEELSKALAAEFPADQYHLISDQIFSLPGTFPPNLRVETKKPKTVFERRWWLWGVQSEMRRLGCDLFHGTNFSVPYFKRRPSVMTVHDLSPWKNSNWHHAAGRVRVRTPFLIRSGIATMIVTPSEAVRREAMARFGIGADRIAAVPEAAAAWFIPSKAPEHLPRPYFLFAGTLEPRKNVPLTIEAWRELKRTHPVSLVLAGRRRADFAELSAEPGLVILGEVEDRELPGLYSGALAVLYPSLYEGFGLPVLEAMQCGAAVIASKDPAVAEVAGDAAVLEDANDARAWSQTMRRLLEHPDELESIRERCLRRASQFSWRNTARLTREVYEEAIRRFDR
jgi:glycosyltransferase involved in cell wall biosynthesis